MSIYGEVISGVGDQYKYGSDRSPLSCGLTVLDEPWSPYIGMTVGDVQHLLSCPSESEAGVVDQSVSKKYNAGSSVSGIKGVG